MLAVCDIDYRGFHATDIAKNWKWPLTLMGNHVGKSCAEFSHRFATPVISVAGVNVFIVNGNTFALTLAMSLRLVL